MAHSVSLQALHQALRWRISRQAAVVYLVCLGLCSLVLGLAVRQVDIERDQAIASELESNAMLAQTQESRVSNALQILDQVLLVLRDDYASHGKPPALNLRLAAMHVDRSYVGIVSLIGAQGEVIATTAEGMNINFSDREYFKAHATDPTDELLIGKPILGRLTGKPLVSLTRRISRADGSFAGVVFLALDPVFLAPDYSNIQLAKDATITLVGLDGFVRVRQTNGSNSFGEDVRAGQILNEVRKAPSGKFISVTPIDGQRRATGYRKLADHPLVVLVGSSTQAVTDSLFGSERVYMLSAALACLLVIGLAGGITQAFARSQKQLEAAAETAAKMRAIIDVSPVPMALNDVRGRISSLNQAFTETYGYVLEDIPSMQAWWQLASPDPSYRQRIMATWLAEIKRCEAAGTRFVPFEIRLRCKDGRSRMAVASTARYSHSNEAEYLVVLFDITQREAAERALQTSLHEKEALLKEVHHRVKNNLQLITSLIRLEVGRSEQPEVKSVLGDMQGRVRSMALLHESLYRDGTFASIDLGRYIGQLASQVFRANLSRHAQIELRLDVAAVAAGLDQAVPCGLLVNELITNSLKHGFPAGRPGSVTVGLHPVDEGVTWRLSVSDTGVGLPEDFDTRRQGSLGLQLACGLANQLGAELIIGSGATFAVLFKILRPDSKSSSN